MRRKKFLLYGSLFYFAACFPGCSQKNTQTPAQQTYSLSFTVNGIYNGLSYTGISQRPEIRFSFTAAMESSAITTGISFRDAGGNPVPFTVSLLNSNTMAVLQPAGTLAGLTKYSLAVSAGLVSSGGARLVNPVSISLSTGIDSSDKFPRISDSALLTLVEAQTFQYFWNFGHPVSGMARERSSSQNTCATGGTGFGIMSMLVAASRNFISRTDALSRIQKITDFLTSNCIRYHGAFAHWIDGSTGATIPFSSRDDGGDIVETSYLMTGLLCARQYFNLSDPAETTLRTAINNLWYGVDWNWYRQNDQQVLYWNWSPDYNWAVNVPVKGWNEALITYVLAASSPSSPIPKSVYDSGWAQNGAIRNGNFYYGIQLPLGPALGGPLFFSQYSFMGINPHDLSDAYANYWSQDTAHTKINYAYCVSNPHQFYGYSSQCWGLTASDEENGYSAHAPDNDDGVISPTAAIASMPYDPVASLQALKFFYYTLGDRLWGSNGFTDAFNLSGLWFDPDCLAIDQGPEIVMIENYRTGLLWNLFMSCPEVKTGMHNLGFQSPNL